MTPSEHASEALRITQELRPLRANPRRHAETIRDLERRLAVHVAGCAHPDVRGSCVAQREAIR